MNGGLKPMNSREAFLRSQLTSDTTCCMHFAPCTKVLSNVTPDSTHTTAED